MSPYYYLEQAKEEARKSNCDQNHWGAVLVDWRGKIIGRGHNHVPHPDLFRYCKPCIRVDIRSCTEQERCAAVHAEEDAIINVYKNGNSIDKDTDMYLYGYNEVEGIPDNPIVMKFYPCMLCARFIIRYKVARVWFFRPVAETEQERLWLPFPKHEKDYGKPYLPDYIEMNQFWFHPGVWLGLEGHELQASFKEDGVFKLGKERKTS